MSFNVPAEAIYVSKNAYGSLLYVRMARVEREQIASNAVAFNMFDAKGREYGARYSIDREVNEIDAASNSLVRLADVEVMVGESFVVYPHALRDGAAFGAIPVRSRKRFASEDEAVAYGEAYIEAARKRAAK